MLSCLPECIIEPIQACVNLDCAVPSRAEYLKLSVSLIKVRHDVVVQCAWGASCRPDHILRLQVQFQPTEVRIVILFILRLVIQRFYCNVKVTSLLTETLQPCVSFNMRLALVTLHLKSH